MNSSSSTGTPVCSASSANVTPPSAENRSNAGASRKSSETSPLRMAAPRPSSGMPASTRLLHQARPTEVPGVNRSVRVGREDPQLDQPAQLLDADAGSLGRLGQVVPLHERSVARSRDQTTEWWRRPTEGLPTSSRGQRTELDRPGRDACTRQTHEEGPPLAGRASSCGRRSLTAQRLTPSGSHPRPPHPAHVVLRDRAFTLRGAPST